MSRARFSLVLDVTDHRASTVLIPGVTKSFPVIYTVLFPKLIFIFVFTHMEIPDFIHENPPFFWKEISQQIVYIDERLLSP